MINKMSNKKMAFSLIELMVVVAIIGILSSIAIPAYSDYMVRARIAEGMVILDKLKQMSAEYYSSNGSFPNLAQLGIAANSYTTTNISTIAIAPVPAVPPSITTETQITVNFQSTVGAGSNAELHLISNSAGAATAGIISWGCHSSNILQRYLPTSCTNP